MRTVQLRGLRAALVAFSLTAAVSAAGAQPVQKDPAQPPAGGMAERQRQMQAMMFEGITLTDAQTKSRDSIQTAYQGKMQAAAREDRMALREEQQKAIRALLTADQQKVYDANLEKMRANRPQRPNGR